LFIQNLTPRQCFFYPPQQRSPASAAGVNDALVYRPVSKGALGATYIGGMRTLMTLVLSPAGKSAFLAFKQQK
jgi:hypothetical protein